MGVDVEGFATHAADPRVLDRIGAVQQLTAGRRIVLGVDRLDYTKGIPWRLEAFARLFEREPDLRDRLRYIQIAVPSRGARLLSQLTERRLPAPGMFCTTTVGLPGMWRPRCRPTRRAYTS